MDKCPTIPTTATIPNNPTVIWEMKIKFLGWLLQNNSNATQHPKVNILKITPSTTTINQIIMTALTSTKMKNTTSQTIPTQTNWKNQPKMHLPLKVINIFMLKPKHPLNITLSYKFVASKKQRLYKTLLDKGQQAWCRINSHSEEQKKLQQDA